MHASASSPRAQDSRVEETSTGRPVVMTLTCQYEACDAKAKSRRLAIAALSLRMKPRAVFAPPASVHVKSRDRKEENATIPVLKFIMKLSM